MFRSTEFHFFQRNLTPILASSFTAVQAFFRVSFLFAFNKRKGGEAFFHLNVCVKGHMLR
jgi:hypothetical protein